MTRILQQRLKLGVGLLVLISASAYAMIGTPKRGSAGESEGSVAGTGTERGGTKHIVPLDRIVSGGVPMDGIPSIDNPKFISASEGDEFLSDADAVFGIYYSGEARAYPAMIMVWHEIVNDVVNRKPVLITYCPLCYAAIAYERMIDGQAVQFGVSGKLYNSDLVMYDRLTESYWSQILGKAIVGEFAGRELTRIPLDSTTWSVWKQLHPDTLVLSKDTGYTRSYGVDPYQAYYTSGEVWFPLEHSDQRLHPKTLIYGLTIGQSQKAYTRDIITQRGVINDQVDGIQVAVWAVRDNPTRAFDRHVGNVTLEFTIDGGRIFDTPTHSEWNVDGLAISGPYEGTQLTRIDGVACFWFAWAAFYENGDLYS